MPLTDSQRADFARLVQSRPVVLFMKGNRDAPACGFSATVVGILGKLLPTFQTIDILQDPRIREGMKEFSNWPTFPQLYVKGEFVGGCDIVKEIYGSGELQKLVESIPVDASGAAPQPPHEEEEAPPLRVTPAAAKALAEALGESGQDVLHLEIDARYNNDLNIAPRNAGDVGVQAGGVLLYMSADSVRRASGVAIDFVSTPGGMAFKIDNPNAPARVKPLSAQELKAMLGRGAVHLFDVRPEGERALASIGEAKPFDGPGQQGLASLDRHAAIALHCHHGTRSRAAAERLIGDGYTNVYNLEGGIEAWSRDVDPSIPRY